MKPNHQPKVLYNCKLLKPRKDSFLYEEILLVNKTYARSIAEALKLAGITKIEIGEVANSNTASISISMEEIIMELHCSKELRREVFYRVEAKPMDQWV